MGHATIAMPPSAGGFRVLNEGAANAAIDLPGDTFLRSYLGLQSSMVRLSPF